MKLYNEMFNIGKAKYVVNYHNGTSKHSDGSNFYDIHISKNRKEHKAFIDNLISEGYIYKNCL